MSKKHFDVSRFWKIMERIALVATIIGAFVGVLAWLGANPYVKLSKKTDKGLVSIQQKCDASSAEISKMDPTEVPQEVMQVHQMMLEMKNDYQLVNKYIKHKKEISRRKYLKSLSTVELVKLAIDEREVSGTLIRESLMPSISKIDEPSNQLDEKVSAIYKMNHQNLYDESKVVYKKMLNWQTEMKEIDVELNDYMKRFNPYNNQNKPERKLFKICKKVIYAKKEVKSLKEWCKYIEMYVDYLSELQEYYIQNQSNKKLN